MRLIDSVEVPVYANICGRRIDSITLTHKDVQQLLQLPPAKLYEWMQELAPLFRPPTKYT